MLHEQIDDSLTKTDHGFLWQPATNANSLFTIYLHKQITHTMAKLYHAKYQKHDRPVCMRFFFFK